MRTRSLAVAVLLLGVGLFARDQSIQPFTDGIEGGSTNCGFCLSRDGKRLVLNHWEVWDIPSRKRVLSGQLHGAWAWGYSPDGKLFAVGGNYSEFVVYNAQTGAIVWNLTFRGHGDTVLKQIEFTPDGQYMVSCSDNGMLRVWDVKAKKAKALYCFTSHAPANNSWTDYVRAWKDRAGDTPPDGVDAFVVFKQPIYTLAGFAISPDSKSIAVARLGTSDTLLLELTSGKVLETFRTKQKHNMSVRFSHDGKLLAIGGGDEEKDTGKCTIELWDVATGKRLRTCPAHRHSVLHMAFSPDDKQLASGGVADGVRVWDVRTSTQIYALHQEGEVRSLGLAFLPDGKALLTLPHVLNAPVHFWEPATGKRLMEYTKPPKTEGMPK